MSVEESVKTRIRQLIDQAQLLRKGSEYGQVRSDQHLEECSGWLGAAWNIVQLVCPDPNNGYRKRIEQLANKKALLTVQSKVGEAAEILKNLLHDIDAGLLASITDQARAETFDNFLDHAKVYLSEQRIREAGVISGVVFEDALRRICDKHGIPEKDRKLDELISELAKAQIITQTKAKRGRTAAHVRTKATHAQWDEFDESDVRVTIEFTEELIMTKLDK